MGQLSFTWSVVDQNVLMWRIPVFSYALVGFIPIAKHESMVMKYLKLTTCHIRL
jgi:hypothetical protein